MKEKSVQYPVLNRFYITKLGKAAYFMEPIDELAGEALYEAKLKGDKYHVQLSHGILYAKNLTIVILEANDEGDVPPSIRTKLRTLFNNDIVTGKPAGLDYDTLIGSNLNSECGGYMDHYQYGLARLGHPENVVIYEEI